jgi:putative ABC transport system permease protein
MSESLVVGTENSNVILLASGSEESLERSQIASNSGSLVSASVSGIKSKLGTSYVSPEVHVALMVRSERDSPDEMRALIRGISPEAFLVYPRVQIIEGRAPVPGKNELILGSLAAEMMGVPDDKLGIGKAIWFDNRAWSIVGKFKAKGTVMDAEIWTPYTDLQVAGKRDTLSCVVVTLDGTDFADLDAFTKQRLDLELTAIPETEYFASIMKFYKPVHMMVWSTALLIALAGLLGGANTMYAAFATRVREIGTLESLGFTRGAIVISLLQESLLTAAAGTLIASVLGLLLINGIAVRFSMGVFELVVDHRVILTGLLAGLVIGIIGALPPAWRCLRLPIPEALKAG